MSLRITFERNGVKEEEVSLQYQSIDALPECLKDGEEKMNTLLTQIINNLPKEQIEKKKGSKKIKS